MIFLNLILGAIALLFQSPSGFDKGIKINDGSKSFIKLYKGEKVCSWDRTYKPCGVEWKLKNSHLDKNIIVTIDTNNANKTDINVPPNQDIAIGCTTTCIGGYAYMDKRVLSTKFEQ